MFKNYLISFVIISTISLMANDKSKFYIGTGYESGSTVATETAKTDYFGKVWKKEEKIKGTMKSKFLTIGYIFDSSNRFEISYGELTDNIDSFTDVRFTFLAPYYNYKILNFTPYWAIGLNNMTAKNLTIAKGNASGPTGGYEKDTAMRVLASLGLLYDIYKDIEIGIGYNVSSHNMTAENTTIMKTFVFNIKYKI